MVAEIINQEIAALFDERGESYSDAWASLAKRRLSQFETGLVRKAVELVLESSHGGKIKTLDIGIGTGRISEAILKYNVEHYGIDISPVMIDYCKEKFKDNEKIKHLAVHDIVNPLPESWGKFDVITAIRVLSYTPLWQDVVSYIYKLLKPGGIFVFTFPNNYSSAFLSKLVLGSEHRGQETTYGELRQVVKEAGFSKVRIEGFARLLDTFYDWCDSELLADILFSVESALRLVFGRTWFARLFYVTCMKK